MTCADPADTFSVFSRNYKRRYINALDRNVIIPEQYEKAFGVIQAHTGKIIIPAKYDNVRMVSDKLFEVEDMHDRTSMLIDLEGRIIQTNRK